MPTRARQPVRRDVAPSPPVAARHPGGVVSVRYLRGLALRLKMAGVAVAPVLADAGIEPTLLFDADAFVSTRALADAWRLAVERTGDPDLGLRTVELVDLKLLGLQQGSDYLLISLCAACPNLDAALVRYVRYLRSTWSTAEMRLHRTPDGAAVEFALPGPTLPPAFVEFWLGTIVQLGRGATQEAVVPSAIEFRHPARETDAHERVLGVRPTFGAARNALLYSSAALGARLTSADVARAEVLERQARAALARVDQGGSFVDDARTVIAAQLAHGISADDLARTLAVSVRTLTRRLRQAGLSHRLLLDEERRRLAEHHLADERLTIADVATLLGFSDAPSFVRAFKRWFGVAPTSHRARRRPPHA